MRKYLFLIVAIAGVALLFLGGYFLRQYMSQPGGEPTTETGDLPDAGDQTGVPADQPGQNQSNQPGLGGGAFKQVVSGAVFNYFVESAGSVLFVQSDGQIIESKDGKNTILSSTKIEGLARAAFSYDGSKVLEIFGQQTAPQASIFDTKTKTWQPLDFVPEAYAWSPSDNRLVFLTHSNAVGILSTLDVSNKKAKPVELLRARMWGVSLSWPAKNRIIIEEKTTSLTRGSAWAYDTDKKTLTSLVGERRGLRTAWNKDASLGLVFSVSETSGGSLSLADGVGKLIQGLNIKTRPDKCVFSERIETATSTEGVSSTKKAPTKTKTIRLLNCAIPRDFSTLPDKKLIDDYDREGFYSIDNFYQISLEDGSSRPLFTDQAKSLDASLVRVYLNRIYFVDRYGTGLYSIAM